MYSDPRTKGRVIRLLRRHIVCTQRNIFEILLDQIEFRLYLPSDLRAPLKSSVHQSTIDSICTKLFTRAPKDCIM